MKVKLYRLHIAETKTGTSYFYLMIAQRVGLRRVEHVTEINESPGEENGAAVSEFQVSYLVDSYFFKKMLTKKKKSGERTMEYELSWSTKMTAVKSVFSLGRITQFVK